MALSEFAERLFNEPKQKSRIFKEALNRIRELVQADGGTEGPGADRVQETGESGRYRHQGSAAQSPVT